jgi:hypothetical protein
MACKNGEGSNIQLEKGLIKKSFLAIATIIVLNVIICKAKRKIPVYKNVYLSVEQRAEDLTG